MVVGLGAVQKAPLTPERTPRETWVNDTGAVGSTGSGAVVGKRVDIPCECGVIFREKNCALSATICRHSPGAGARRCLLKLNHPALTGAAW